MTGSMYAAIAGLKTHMSKMNVIGHNIANVNTQGYKAQRALFKDAMYTMYKTGSNGTTTVGGRNPSQIGYGSQVSSIDLDMSTGTFTPGNPMDCMINGDGFFLVGDKTVADVIDPENPTSFKSLQLSRVGDFKFGPDGYLVDGNGTCVYGFMTVGVQSDGSPIVSDQLVAIRLPKMEKVAISIDPDDMDTYGQEIPADTELDPALEGVSGEGGWEYTYVARYPTVIGGDAVEADNGVPTAEELLEYEGMSTKLKDYEPPVDAGAGGADADATAVPEELAYVQLDSITIDGETGRISGTLKDTNEWITIGFLAIGNVTNPNGVTHEGGYYYTAGDGAGDLSIAMLGGVQKDLYTVGGGRLTHVNASTLTLEEDEALEDVLSRKAEITSAGVTYLEVGGLEGSRVDLATEISDMITTQRGYQANTRIITVTDTMLEELVNMKR